MSVERYNINGVIGSIHWHRMGPTEMTKADIEAVMREIPELGDFGVGIFNQGRGKSLEERRAEREAEKRALLNSADICTKICEWLADFEMTKAINHKHSSYGLKHLAEKEIGYITNGAFIAAAVHSGFPFKVFPDSPNMCFGISERSIKAKKAALKTEA